MRTLLLAGVATVCLAGTANADTYAMETVTGTFFTKATLSGSFVFDQTTQAITSSSLVYSGLNYVFDSYLSTSSFNGDGSVVKFGTTDSTNPGYVLDLVFTQANYANFLAGRTAQLDINTDVAAPGGRNTYSGALASGMVVPSAVAPTAVPEPASIALLGMGVAGIAAMRRRREG